ncbi:sentrin-specific protease 8-like [Coccinella septempunctata]|uniref:sentrin-specific protease 8-like n=1 Tax=Coccinella septempunctata TaxID=41139 RepID=UPI001D0763DB|nr:sentrin-specific protease 8-like [Coccinella septempunctata]
MYPGSSPNLDSDITICLGDSLLRKQDIELLRTPSWLNDTVIAFYFEYLETNVFRGNKATLCVPPQVTQCVKMIPANEISAFLDPLKAHKKNLILFALNDHEFCEAAGGTHWSLLVFSKLDSRIYHFDSCNGLNRNQAIEFGQKLAAYLGKSFHESVIEASCLQQNNNYDCGVHVLCNAEHIINYAARNRTVEGCPILDQGTVNGFRRKMFDIVMDIGAKSKKF